MIVDVSDSVANLVSLLLDGTTDHRQEIYHSSREISPIDKGVGGCDDCGGWEAGFDEGWLAFGDCILFEFDEAWPSDQCRNTGDQCLGYWHNVRPY
ncbi:MAG: hypothetical protein ABI876_04225 [Bacteroidota bacterium]